MDEHSHDKDAAEPPPKKRRRSYVYRSTVTLIPDKERVEAGLRRMLERAGNDDR